jgi:hypothetical protein
MKIIIPCKSCKLKVAEDCQVHQAIVHGLYFMDISLYHRNELHTAEEKLVVVVEEPYAQHVLNFATVPLPLPSSIRPGAERIRPIRLASR